MKKTIFILWSTALLVAYVLFIGILTTLNAEALVEPSHASLSCSTPCHISGINASSSNYCQMCHQPGDTLAGNKPLAAPDASMIFGGQALPAGATRQQTSHRWDGSDINPAAGALPPIQAAMTSIRRTIGSQLACERCHSIHHYDTASTKGLRMQNSQDQMCMDCHRSRAQQSQLTGTHPVNIDYNTKALANPTKYKASPDNANPANPTSSLGSKLVPTTYGATTIVCSTCHGIHFTDSRSATFDGASSAKGRNNFVNLSSGDGYVLHTDRRGTKVQAGQPDKLNICTNCHAGKTSHNAKGQDVQCSDCHGAHVEYDSDDPTNTKGTNVYLIRRNVTKAGQPGKVYFRYTDSNSREYKNAMGTGVCQGCHDVPPSGGIYPPAHDSNNAADCTTCHFHGSPAGSFSVQTYDLSVRKSGNGSGNVTLNNGRTFTWNGMNGTASYMSGASVTLTASPVNSDTFTGWSGACSGTGTCQVTMDATKNVIATFIDTTPPVAPSVSGTALTNNTKPTWSWTSGGGGNGSYRARLDNSDLTSGTFTPSGTSYTPLSSLTEGPHTLYVQEQDSANNWSLSGSFAITIDTTAPAAPSVSGTALTNNTKPTWSWTSGGEGNGSFRARLDNSDLTSGTFTPSGTSYTPLSPLIEGPHTLYVQEQDSTNNWSLSGSFVITIDTTAPTVDAFSLPANVNGLTATNITFSASDSAGISSWCLTETNSSSSCSWQGSQPTSFTFSSSTYGSRSLYAFVRDAANNTSAPVSNSATSNLIPISFTLSTPTAVVLAQGETNNRNITVTATGGYSSSTDMGATVVGGMPAGVTLGFSPQNLVPSPGGSTVSLTVSTTVATPPSSYTIRVTATGSGDTKTVDIPFTVVLPLSITTSSLTAAVKGTAYTAPINTLGGVGAISCSLANGSALPAGLTLSGCSISGTPTTRVVSAPFTINASDSTTHTTSQILDLRVYDPAYRALQLSSSLGWSVIKNDVSGAITARVIDDYGFDANVAFNTQITISSSSSTGRFSLDGISFSFGSTVNPSIPQGTNALTFLYRDTVAGNYTITASQISQSWTSDSHTISVTTVPDTTPPVITAFTIPATSTSLTVAITTLNATDASGVVEYCVMEADSTNGCSWSTTPPPDHTFASFGSKTLYAFARDGSGNISAANLSHSKTVTLTPQKLTLFLSKSEAAAGSVTSNPTGITCLTDCNATFAQFNEFDQIALTATPAAGYYFLNWNNCSNVTNNLCTVTMQTGMSPVTANFSAKKITTLSLFPKLQTLRLNDPLTLNGQLSTIPAGQTIDLNGQKIAVTISGPNGIVIRETTTTDNSGTWSYPISGGDIFTKRGTYLISVKFTGAEKLMDSQSETVTILVEKSAGYAIVIHGKLANNEGIDDHKLTTENVIKQLKARSILDSNIKYLYSTTDSVPLKADVQTAIETWARDKMDGSPAPLYVVMVDHGSIGKFHLGGDTGDFIITPGDMNTWLTNLENGLTKPEAKLEKRFIVIGTCYSGSFISALSQKPSPGNAGRVVITSADPNEQSIRGPKIPIGQGLFKRSGEYFLDEFFTRIGRGDTIRDSFRYASDVIRNKDSRKVAIAIHDGVMDTLAQHPLIDDNGDKIGSYALDNNHDGSAVASLYIGDGAVKTNAADNPADIKATTPAQFLQSTQNSTQLWLTAGTFSRIGNAWVEIRKPVSAVNSSSGQVILELETVNLTPNVNQSRWDVTSSVFIDQGTYEIFYYTQDSLTGEISPMAHSYVYKARTDAVDNASPTIFDLKSPANGSQQSSILALEWNSSSDGDGLTYTVSVASDAVFGSEVFHQEGINDTFTVIPSGALQNDTTYYWRVIATDAFGAQRASTHSWSFTTSNNNALPGFVKGYVINKADNSPISDASISTTDGSTTSLSTGVFLLPLPPNDYTLTISASGFLDETIPVSLSTGTTTSSVVYLQHIQPVNGECGIAINSTHSAAPSQDLCKDGTSPAVGGNGPWTWICPGTNGGAASPTCTAGVTQFGLSLSIDGSGNGSVNCSKGVDSVGCNGSFNPGDGISLHATSDWKSLPVLWGGSCSGSTPPDCVLTMAGNLRVIATFNANYQAQIAAAPYSSLQSALNSADNGATVVAMAYNFLEPILFDRSGIEVFVDGGRGPNFAFPTVGYTVVNGSFRIKQGAIRVKGPVAIR